MGIDFCIEERFSFCYDTQRCCLARRYVIMSREKGLYHVREDEYSGHGFDQNGV